MKKTIFIYAALLLAPISFMAAQPGTASAGSLRQLQNWAPAEADLPDFSVPVAVPAGQDGFDMEKLGDGVWKSADTRGMLCCSDGASCMRARTEGFAALGVQQGDLRSWESSLAAFKKLTASRWYTSFPDGTALTDGSVGSFFVTRKSFVGMYKFKIESMAVEVTWNPDPLLGFAKPGAMTMSMSKVCVAQDRIDVFASGHRMSISAAPQPTMVQPSPNTGTNVPVRRDGYLMTTEYGQYLVSSDGK